MENCFDKAYNDKLEAIFTRFPSVQKVPFGDAYKPGLDHMIRFAALLGDPQGNFRTIKFPITYCAQLSPCSAAD